LAKTVNLRRISEAIPYFLSMPSRTMWIDYDEEADVLYISFQRPQNATDSEITDDTIVHRRGREVVGVTVLHASDYLKPEQAS